MNIRTAADCELAGIALALLLTVIGILLLMCVRIGEIYGAVQRCG